MKYRGTNYWTRLNMQTNDYKDLSKEQLIALLEMTDDFNYCDNIGKQYQDFVTDELYKIGIIVSCYSSRKYQLYKGESVNGIEIKHDSKFRSTNRFYFEISANNKVGNGYINGGIRKEDNAWLYVIGDEKDIYIFAKSQLRELAQRVEQNPKLWAVKYGVETFSHKDSNGKITSSGICVPLKEIERAGWCIKHISL